MSDLELLSEAGNYIQAQLGDDGTVYVQVNNSDVRIYDKSHALALANWILAALSRGEGQ